MLFYLFLFLVRLERGVGVIVMVAVNLVHVLQRCFCLDEDFSFRGETRCKVCIGTCSGGGGVSKGIGNWVPVTYNDRLFVRLGNGLVQSVEERSGHLAHSLRVGEQPVHVNNLAERK